jgi:hypothetical protein
MNEPLPDGLSISGYCILALGDLGNATSLEVLEWLKMRRHRYRIQQIRGALSGLARPKVPLIIMAERIAGSGMPGVWCLSDAGQIHLRRLQGLAARMRGTQS